ncbi:hypothetical protein C8J56DRAFT_1054241 [Mycena floridula]|nr:hypothetical protein C8J56DRAFT_1054241 [Mycena floridula]
MSLHDAQFEQQPTVENGDGATISPCILLLTGVRGNCWSRSNPMLIEILAVTEAYPEQTEDGSASFDGRRGLYMQVLDRILFNMSMPSSAVTLEMEDASQAAFRNFLLVPPLLLLDLRHPILCHLYWSDIFKIPYVVELSSNSQAVSGLQTHEGRYHRYLKTPGDTGFSFVPLGEEEKSHIIHRFQVPYLDGIKNWNVHPVLDAAYASLVEKFPHRRHDLDETDILCRSDHISVISHFLYNSCMPGLFKSAGIYDMVMMLDPSYPTTDAIYSASHEYYAVLAAEKRKATREHPGGWSQLTIGCLSMMTSKER